MKFLLCVDGSNPSKRATDKLCELMNPKTDSAIIYSAFIAPIPQYFTRDPGSCFHASSDHFFPIEPREYHGESIGAMEALDAAKNRMLGNDANVTALMFGVDDIGKSIVSYAQKNGIDAIIMGSRGLGLLRRKLLRSVSGYVSDHAPCKVVTCK